MPMPGRDVIGRDEAWNDPAASAVLPVRPLHRCPGAMRTAAEFIRAHEEEIVRSWGEEAARAASSRGLERPELMNVMAVYIADFSSEDLHADAASSARRKHIDSHLSARIRQGFSVEEVIDEILLVGTCIERVSNGATRAEARIDPVDLERIRQELTRAAGAVAQRFATHMAEDEQSEKRYLRLLRSRATRALEDPALPLKTTLRDALELIVEAVGVHVAVLLLYEPDSAELVSAASFGIEGMDEQVSALDLSSLAGKIASSPQATAVEDAATTQLAIPDALRRSGIHSLLGIRLPAQRTLTGVLYVGLREQREFSVRESHRLEVLGEQLTIHLDNARLFAALKEQVGALEVERELREKFVSILAHDLRGPLSAARMAASLAKEARREGPLETFAERQYALALRVERNVDRADRMVRDLLDANRIHAGEPLCLRLVDCELVALVRGLVDELTDVHGPRFVLTGDERVEGVWSPDEVRRAVWNLAVNAVKYGAEDEPITIRIERSEGWVSVSVQNLGEPISPTERENLFRPFTRAARAGARPGWGLGLTLVRGAAEAHGGRVKVASDDLSGTTFTIELPLDARPYQPPRSPSDDTCPRAP